MTQAPSFPETLRALKQASDEARAKYRAYKPPAGLAGDDAIAADLTERRLLRACVATEEAYKQELDNWVAGSGGLK